tara:strand:- start:28263 stop:29045 length:783 start_codon:yes stop_codon:yes gene_type:complete
MYISNRKFISKMEAYVTLSIENKVGYIEFYHPNRNSMPSDILSKLEETITDAGKNDAIKVIVLKSGGDRTFCAGASFNEVITIEDEEAGVQFFSGFAKVINAMRKCPKLIIGRVQGKAVGGGVGLAAATDYCLATIYASIRLSELSIGIGPFVIEPAVSRKIGKTAMAEMTIDAESFFSSEFAKSKGLYAEVLSTTEALDIAVETLVNKLAGYNPEALSNMKKVLWEGTDNWDVLLLERAKISGKLVLSDFTKKTLKRFR